MSTETLRIAIPTSGPGGIDAARSAHFGHADSFTIVEVDDGQIVRDTAITNPPHSHGGFGATVTMLAQAGVGTAIVVGMGRGPLAAMAANGMTPLFDDQSPTPRAAVEAFLGGRRSEFGGQHVCQGH
jgi:predicted Fe-Mo cluster-binding NifX family protein